MPASAIYVGYTCRVCNAINFVVGKVAGQPNVDFFTAVIFNKFSTFNKIMVGISCSFYYATVDALITDNTGIATFFFITPFDKIRNFKFLWKYN